MTKLTAATFVLGLMATWAMAEPLATVRIPFAFRVGDTELPAGSYEIGNVAMNAVRIVNMENKNIAVAINPIPIRRNDPSAQPAKLVFNRYGTDYYLSEMWPSGTLSGRAIPRCGREIELAKKIQPVRIDLITASRP
jgi:hypothetical protein